MGFLSSVFSGAVKTICTPIAIVKDVVNVATGEDPEATKKLMDSISDDAKDVGDYMCGEK